MWGVGAYGNSMVNICIPTLNRYDLLRQLLTNLLESTITLDAVYIIDNGNRYNIEIPQLNIIVHKPERNLGVAGSWNWFINNVPEIRIIMNDDIQLYPDSIGGLVSEFDENNLVFPSGLGISSFSCFILPDNIIKDVGLFDETISPGYAYFEDNDYSHRMSIKGYGIKPANINVGHHGSSTLRLYTSKERMEHHRKFDLARKNYQRKWGGTPGKEKYHTPFGK